MNLCMYTRPTWCTYVSPLQPYRDITFVLSCRLINVGISLLFFLTIFICYKRNARELTHCICDIHAPLSTLNVISFYIKSEIFTFRTPTRKCKKSTLSLQFTLSVNFVFIKGSFYIKGCDTRDQQKCRVIGFNIHLLPSLEGDTKICPTQKIHVARGRSPRETWIFWVGQIFVSPD